MVAVLVVVAGAYAVGTFPTALLVGRSAGFDPTAGGSGNPGASNALRLGGRRAGMLVLAGDAAKGALGAAAGFAVGGRAAGFAAGAVAVVGHMAPVTRRFRGGKGVATAAGMAAVLLPIPAAAAAAVFAVAVAVTRTASIASLVATVALVVATAVQGRSAGELVAVAAVAVAIVARHRANLGRLVRGSELPIERSTPR